MKEIKSISFIGAGNVATHLAKAFFRKNVQIREVFSRSEANAAKLATQVQATVVTELEKTADVDCIIICTPDDVVFDVYEKLQKPETLIVHTSGIKGLHPSGRTGYLYPLQSFRKEHELNVSEIPFFIAANQLHDVEIIEVLASKISTKVAITPNEKKQHLHLAAVIINNFVNHLFGLTADYLTNEELNFTHLKPIIETTIERALTNNPLSIQTGPALRNDKQTIDAHEELLTDYPQLKQVYQQLSKSIQEVHNV